MNLFIDHTEVIELTAHGTRLWAPKEPWGKIRYKKSRFRASLAILGI